MMGGSIVSLLISIAFLLEESRRWMARDGMMPIHSSMFTSFDLILPSSSTYITYKGNHYKDAPSQTQIAIEPGRPDSASVRLHTQLAISVGLDLRDRLQTKIGRIGVCRDDRIPVSRLVLSSNRDGNDTRFVASEKVLPHRLDAFSPLRLLVDALESVGGETLAAFLHHMKSAASLAEKLHKGFCWFQKLGFHFK